MNGMIKVSGKPKLNVGDSLFDGGPIIKIILVFTSINADKDNVTYYW